MSNKLTKMRVEFDTGMQDFMPKPYFTEKDLKKSGEKKLKPSLTIRKQKFKNEFIKGTPSQEIESEFGIKISKDQKGIFFKKKFKRGGDVMKAAMGRAAFSETTSQAPSTPKLEKYNGSYMHSEIDGRKVSNDSLVKYYGPLLKGFKL